MLGDVFIVPSCSRTRSEPGITLLPGDGLFCYGRGVGRRRPFCYARPVLHIGDTGNHSVSPPCRPDVHTQSVVSAEATS